MSDLVGNHEDPFSHNEAQIEPGFYRISTFVYSYLANNSENCQIGNTKGNNSVNIFVNKLYKYIAHHLSDVLFFSHDVAHLKL